MGLHVNEYSDNAVHFEGVKLKMVQDKNGYVLTLSIHPQEVPESLLRQPVGSRYTVAMVALDDQDRSVPPERHVPNKAVQLAGVLCKEKPFHRFLQYETGKGIFGDKDCRDVLCDILGITSRKDLATDDDARVRFRDLYRKYRNSEEYGAGQ